METKMQFNDKKRTKAKNTKNQKETAGGIEKATLRFNGKATQRQN